jgi:invasion associated locus B (IalB) protein
MSEAPENIEYRATSRTGRLAFTLPNSLAIPCHWWTSGFGLLVALEEGPMTVMKIIARITTCALPIALAASLVTAAAAQQPAPGPSPAPAAKPAPKPATTAAVGNPSAPSPTLLGQFGDWGAYTASPNGAKVCFALGKPKASQTNPPGRNRDPAYVFISTRPAENVRNEVSVIIGYPFKSASDATAEIGATKFAMYTQNDGAWIKNVAEEARMIDAMRKGADLTIKGTSGRGTASTDTYSLKGLAQAIERVEQECK